MKIIDKLKDTFEQAEFLTKTVDELKINIENWDLQNIGQEHLTRSSLRVTKDGKKGSNTTIGNSDKVMKRLIEGAAESASYGEEATFSFSSATASYLDETGRRQYQKIATAKIFAFIEDCLRFIKDKAEEITLDLHLNKTLETIEIQTTNGGNSSEEITNFQLVFGSPIPGGGSFIYRTFEQPEFFKGIPADAIDDFLDEYRKAYQVSVPGTGKMPVLFSPRALYFLFISLQEGISAKNIYQETSPLLNRIGEQVFSDKLTIIDKPHMAVSGSRRHFDDEGIPTREQPIIQAGTLQNYIYDLEYAARMGKEPTGNGLKHTLFGSGINTPVSPNLVNPVIEPGDKCKEELISAIDEGILVDGIVGFHSSNYQQGHFSVQAHGFHIKDGKLLGRLQDVMIAGNIYEDFKNIREIGDTIYPAMKGYTPYILVDDVSVTGK